MQAQDSVRTYYSAAIERHGPTPRGVDWQCSASQQLRFVQLLKVCDFAAPFSLNDFGCGYGALLDYLAFRHGDTPIDYRGIDISPNMIEAARTLRPGSPAAEFVLGEACQRVADYSLASGVFNVRLDCRRKEWEIYVESILRDLRESSRRGFSVNFMRPGRAPTKGLYRSPPERWTAFCEKELGCSVELVEDYGLREFTLLATFPRRRSPGSSGR